MNLDEATVSAITSGFSGGPPPGPAGGQSPAPDYVDPSVIAALQGGFGTAPVNQRMYSPPAPQQDSYALPAPVAHAVQNGFAPVPVGVVDGLGAPNSPQMPPPTAFQPQPLADPFPNFAQYAQQGFAQGAVPSKADVAAAKDTVAAQAADAKAQAKQAAYDATPQGQDDAALKASLGVNQDQQALVAQQGDLEAKAAAAESAVREKALIDSAALQAKVDAAREENLAQQKQMIADRGKDIEAAAKRVPDPNRFYNSLSTMQHIGVGLMTLLAGAGQGLSRDNGPNPVVKMMTDAQDRDIDAQKAGIEQGNKAIEAKKQLQQDYGHLGDDENAMWQYRKAQSRIMLADQLEATAAQYKAPKALLAAKMAADGLRADAAKMVGEQAARRQIQLNKDAELRNQRDQIGIAGGHLALARKEFEEKQLEYKDTRQDKKDAQKEAEDARKELALLKRGAIPEGGVGIPSGRLIQPPGGGKPYAERLPAAQANGEPFIITDKDVKKDFYEKEAATQTYVDATQQLIDLREKSGGHINSRSEGAREALQKQARAEQAMIKLTGSTRLTPEVIKLVNRVASGDEDPETVDSYVKSVTPELKGSIGDVIQDRKYRWYAAGFNGDPAQLDIPGVDNKPPESNQSKFRRIIETTPPETEAPTDFVGKYIDEIRNPSKTATEFGKDGLSDDQRQVMNAIASGLSNFQTHERAVAQLKDIVGDVAAASAIRAVAQAQLDRLGIPKVTVNPE